MMWIFLAVFFLSVGDIFGESCRKRFQECESIDPPRNFPENEEELAHTCNFGLKFASCIAKVAESCEEEEEGRLPQKHVAEIANQMVSSLEIICDRESRNYIAISNNLECISSTVPSQLEMCHRRTISEKRRNLTLAYAETVKDKEVPEPNYMYLDCIGAIFEIACFTTVISEECGGELFKPVLQTLTELYKFNLDAVCPEETISEIPMFAFAFAIVEKEAEHATHELEEPMQAPFDGLFNSFQ